MPYATTPRTVTATMTSRNFVTSAKMPTIASSQPKLIRRKPERRMRRRFRRVNVGVPFVVDAVCELPEVQA